MTAPAFPALDAAALFAAAPSPYLLLDPAGPDHRVLDANPAYEAAVGSNRDRLVGLPVREALQATGLFADGLAELDASLSCASASAQPDLVQRDGLGWSAVNAPLLDADGQVTAILHHLVQTPGRPVAQGLAASEAQFRSLADHAPVMMWITDAGGACTFLNEAWHDFTGQSRAEALGFGWLDAIHPDDRAEAERIFRDANLAQRPFRLEYRLRHADGSYRWAIDAAAPRFGPDGRYLGYVGSVLDIDERRHAERALAENEERLRLATENAEIGFWDVDTVHDVLIWPPRVKAMFGISADAPVSMADYYAGLHPDDRDATIAAFQAACDPVTRGLYDVEYRTIGKEDGRIRWVAAKGRALFDDDGRCVRVIGTAIDISDRRRTAQALQDSETRFRLMADAVPALVWVAGANGQAEFFNRQWFNFTGAPHGPISVDQVASNYVHPDDTAPTLEAFQASSATGETFLIEHRIRAANGQYRWFLVRGEPYRDPLTGEITRWYGASVDIHDRREAEAALHASELRYRTLFEAIDVGFCIIDMKFDADGRAIDYRLAEINPAFERQTGLHDAAGKWVSEAAPGLERYWFDIYGDVAQTGRAVRFENHAEPFGRYYDVHAFRTGTPDQKRVAVLFNDITARRKAELELRDLNQTLERRVDDALAERKLWADVFESSDALIAAMSPERRLLAVNRAYVEEFSRLYGVEPRVGDDLAALLAERPEQQAETMRIWDRALSGEQFCVTAPFGDPGPDRPCYELQFNTLRDRHGHIMGAFQYAVDVTQRLRDQARLAEAEGALRQAQKMESIGQLTGGVAHDFNNLLTPIVGALDMLQRKRLGGEREQRLIAGAAQSADRAKTLVQRLLAFARRQPLQPVAVDMAQLVRNMAELISSTTGPQIKVVVDAPDDLPPALADANQVEMALLNLSVNARDAMPDGGTLRISAALDIVGGPDGSGLAPGRYIKLSVADSGTGMDEATLTRAVEPFFSTKGVGQGTGLGLSMVHGLASQLGGTLKIQSQLGLGTNMELWLPESSSTPGTTTTVAEVEDVPAARGTALLVDDEELVRMTTADMLGELGYRVFEAASAEEALRLVADGLAFDLLVTDHLMPGMNGTNLAREIQGQRPATAILIVSGYAEQDGIDPDLPRLTKPFRRADLAASIGL